MQDAWNLGKCYALIHSVALNSLRQELHIIDFWQFSGLSNNCCPEVGHLANQHRARALKVREANTEVPNEDK